MSDPTGLAPEVFCGDAMEGAALGLLGLMTGISEEFYCAGWMAGLEYALWRAEPGMEYGMGKLTERQATLLRLLHEECGGWWMWHEKAGATFVSAANWLEHVKSQSNT